jgi:hypothetical protein
VDLGHRFGHRTDENFGRLSLLNIPASSLTASKVIEQTQLFLITKNKCISAPTEMKLLEATDSINTYCLYGHKQTAVTCLLHPNVAHRHTVCTYHEPILLCWSLYLDSNRDG